MHRGEWCAWCSNDVDPKNYWEAPPEVGITAKFHAAHCVGDYMAAHGYTEAITRPHGVAATYRFEAAGETCRDRSPGFEPRCGIQSPRRN